MRVYLNKWDSQTKTPKKLQLRNKILWNVSTEQISNIKCRVKEQWQITTTILQTKQTNDVKN
jgi:hypothetical protein